MGLGNTNPSFIIEDFEVPLPPPVPFSPAVSNAAGSSVFLGPPSGSAATDTAAIQAAAAALPSSGGTIVLQPGSYAWNATATFDGLSSVTLRGAGGRSAGSAAATQIVYSPTSGAAISARSTTAFKLQGAQVLYSSSAYSGSLVDLSATGTKGSGSGRGSDTAYALVDDCYLGCLVSANRSASAELVNLDHCIASKLRDSVLEDANYGVTGLSGASSYSNSNTLDNLTFINLIAAPIHNPGDGWTIIKPTVEHLSSGKAGGILLDSGYSTGSIFIINPWFGDFTVNGANTIQINGSAQALTVIGGDISATAGASDSGIAIAGTVQALNVHGAAFTGAGTNGIDITGNVLVWNVTGNNFSGVTNALSSNAWNAKPNGSYHSNYSANHFDYIAPPTNTLALYGALALENTVNFNGSSIGFYGGSAVSQPSAHGTTTGFTAGSGTAMNSASTSTGGSGASAYTFGDVVLALKQLGLIAS